MVMYQMHSPNLRVRCWTSVTGEKKGMVTHLMRCGGTSKRMSFFDAAFSETAN